MFKSINVVNFGEKRCFIALSTFGTTVVTVKNINFHVGDKSLIEFEQLISKQANVVMFHSYDSCTQRLDSFFFNKLNVQQYESLSHVIKCILVLFHGQSQVELGFSVNKALMNDNMQEKTVIARRSVKDYMQTYQLEPHQVKNTKDLKFF